MKQALAIIKLLVEGKPVIDSRNQILYLQGLALGEETGNSDTAEVYDFEEISELKPYVSKERLEIEKLTRQLASRDEKIIKLEEKLTEKATAQE